MKFFKKIKKGFTLVELVVVIAVIAILSGVGVGTYIAVTNNAKQSAADQEAVQLKTAIQVQSISTWANSKDESTPKADSYNVTWDSLKKAVIVRELGNVSSDDAAMKEIALKALDDMVADSQGKGYKYAEHDADHYAFVEPTPADATLFTFEIEVSKNMKGDAFDGVAITKLTLVHTNGFKAVVLDGTKF